LIAHDEAGGLFLDRPRRREAVAAKLSGKITTKQKPSGVFTRRDNMKFTAMSALPPKADIGSTCQDVRFVPKGDITPQALNSQQLCWITSAMSPHERH
jgi:hypothetical protein